MRTTIQIEDELLQVAKKRALDRRTTLKCVVEDALRMFLGVSNAKRPKSFRLITFGRGGTHRGVNLDKTSALLEAEDIERFAGGKGS